jgi:beta-galactosidase GanA
METLGQDYGFILYRTKLIGPRSGNLTATELHDYGLVYVNGTFIDTIDRTRNEYGVKLPALPAQDQTLDILVEAMGRINFGDRLLDRKGITQRVTLRGVTLMNWEAFNLPMDLSYLKSLRFTASDTSDSPKFFKGSFDLGRTGDTFLDVSKWKKGVVWVNGHNLGRYWDIGPQRRLFVPAPWLKTGRNEVIIFDLFLREPAPLQAKKQMNDPTKEADR